MGVAYHTLYVPDGAAVNLFDRVVVGAYPVTYVGGSAGVAVTTVVTFGGRVPTPYAAVVSSVEDSTYYVTSRTNTGCSLVISPRLAANSLAGGTVQLMIVS